MAHLERGPGVRFPPPFIFVGGFLLAWLLQQRLAFDIATGGPGPAQSIVGSVMLVVGLGLMASGLVTFGSNRTAVIPHRPARLLVRSGPYRYTRNPMYLGLTCAYIGLSIVLNWAWPFVVLPIVLIVLTTTVIRREEGYLRAAFGADYDDYCRQVRRWL
jgi:protein-S-isoprenylcysteine O-methyltransferase Ste14